jgi:hypothetical protein
VYKIRCSSVYFSISIYYCENQQREKQVTETREGTELSRAKLTQSVWQIIVTVTSLLATAATFSSRSGNWIVASGKDSVLQCCNLDDFIMYIVRYQYGTLLLLLFLRCFGPFSDHGLLNLLPPLLICCCCLPVVNAEQVGSIPLYDIFPSVSWSPHSTSSSKTAS